MSDYQVKNFIDLVNQNPKEVLFALTNNQNLRDRMNKLVNMCDIGQDLDTPHSFGELSRIYDYTKDIWLKSEDYALADIQYFAAKAINYNMIDVSSLSLIPLREFIDALCDDNTDALYKAALTVLEDTDDRFFFDKESGTLTWLYYNPDSITGGQFVQNMLSYEQILEVAKITSNPQDFFYDQLESRAKQELGDIDTHEFFARRAIFLSGSHTLSGISENTMKALITLAKERENYLKTAEMSSEQNYNQIDGIINNELPRTIGGYAVTENHIVGNYEFAFGENEKAPSPYGSWQRNIKNDEERADGDNWFWGHYFSDKDKAVSDFKERIKDALEEVATKSHSVTTKLKAFKELENQSEGAIHKNKNIER